MWAQNRTEQKFLSYENSILCSSSAPYFGFTEFVLQENVCVMDFRFAIIDLRSQIENRKSEITGFPGRSRY